MSFNTLNDQLAHASKKFTKACDQINILKQRIAELLRMFSYCGGGGEPSLASNTNSTNNINAISNQIPQTTTTTNTFNTSIFKESIRQQIENLQSVKTAYYMYAQKKADEITRLQCELYGEEAVRIAYENASPDVLVSASNAATTTTTTSDQQQSNENEQQIPNDDDSTSNNNLIASATTRPTNIDAQTQSANEANTYEHSFIEHFNSIHEPNESSSPLVANSQQPQSYWTPWNFSVGQEVAAAATAASIAPMNDRMQFRQAQVSSNTQVQLIEYDFLTA
jgi:hypothetical protein